MGEGKGEGAKTATVIAWLWARMVKCPNPACGAQMPLVRSFWLSTKKGKKAWVEPVVDKHAKTVRFEIRTGESDERLAKEIGAGTSSTNERGKKVKATFRCVICNVGIAKGDYIDAEANKGQMEFMPLAIVTEGKQNRTYLLFDDVQRERALEQSRRFLLNHNVREKLPTEPARGTFASNAQGRVYGFKTFADYFTPRQLVALTTFSDLVSEAREQMLTDAHAAGTSDDGKELNYGGTGATAYADAVATYLGMGLSRLSDICNSLCRWETSKTQVRNLFGRQAIPMVWDFAEPNLFAKAAGDFGVSLSNLAKALEVTPCSASGSAKQLNATTAIDGVTQPLISTDPPYYDNIGYADLSDFFYVWLRRSLGKIYPDLFSTLLVPKSQELIATPYRFGGDGAKAKSFFEEGLGKAFAHMREPQHPDYPLTVYYAFKQTEADEDEEEGNGTSAVTSTGWETMLEGLLKADFAITGTWPMRSELSNRPVASGTNALASSIVLVCRPRPEDARPTTRREFLTTLKRELPDALRLLQHGNIAPVDLAQAAIGPGMAVFSRYAKVLEADGSPMRVRTALALINQTLDEVLAEQEGEFDADTRWALAWFEQHGFDEGPFGVAETLSKAKNTAVSGMVEAGILAAKAGKVRLLRRDELPANWDPAKDGRLTVWETTQHLIRMLEKEGESGAAQLLAKLGGAGELARDLAYRLYTTCERKKWAQDALAFNSLVVSWPEIIKLTTRKPEQRQEEMF
jgi:putative DNA methylase